MSAPMADLLGISAKLTLRCPNGRRKVIAAGFPMTRRLRASV
jgi:hypothetical protein